MLIFKRLEEFQTEYAKLDEIYARYFSLGSYIDTVPAGLAATIGLITLGKLAPLYSLAGIERAVDEAELQERESLRKAVE